MVLPTPVYDEDFYGDAVVADPFPRYRALRDLGPRPGTASGPLARHQDCRDALRNPEVFSSARGVTLNEPANEAQKGTVLGSDNPEHAALRAILANPMSPANLVSLKPRIKALAKAHIDRLVDRGGFDAVSDLAHFLPLMVVTDLVGLSPGGKARMLDWASALFDAFGPLDNQRTQAALPIVKAVVDYVAQIRPEDLDRDGWGARLFGYAREGRIIEREARSSLMGYIAPSLDTSINATSSAIWLFACNPDQWDLVRGEPSLIAGAIDETVRLEAPIKAFSRFVTQDHPVGDTLLPAGSRALIVYASANRDERKWRDPDRFDVTRRAHDHLGFGHGVHLCAGLHLAKFEMNCVFEALADRVECFKLGDVKRKHHNTLWGLERLQVFVR